MDSTLPVTLIVKAPNQQIEDQTIKCELSWTINKLKQHLQEVYPSKPPKHEQKLIYSGQLLNDSVMLKDVLRQYEGQETHTVHLVCASSRMAQIKQQQPQPQSSSQQQTQVPQARQTPEQQPASSTSESSNQAAEHRIPPPLNMPWTNDGNIDRNRYALHMAWMQQAYMQYLAQQYAALSTANPQGVQNLQFPSQQNIFAQNPQAPAQQAVGAQDQQQEPPPAQPAAAQQQQRPPVRDMENQERDWLDHFYMLTRIMVLCSIVYFYSSPFRFIFVFVLGLSLYLYQNGLFRNINVNINNNNINPAEQVIEDNQAPSRLMVAWTFFTTFFASLIPEIPNAV